MEDVVFFELTEYVFDNGVYQMRLEQSMEGPPRMKYLPKFDVMEWMILNSGPTVKN
jgi:hypothetical protein